MTSTIIGTVLTTALVCLGATGAYLTTPTQDDVAHPSVTIEDRPVAGPDGQVAGILVDVHTHGAGATQVTLVYDQATATVPVPGDTTIQLPCWTQDPTITATVDGHVVGTRQATECPDPTPPATNPGDDQDASHEDHELDDETSSYACEVELLEPARRVVCKVTAKLSGGTGL